MDLLCNLVERYFCFKGDFSLCYDRHVGMNLPTYKASRIRMLLFIPLLESEIPHKSSFFLISTFCTCSMSVIQINCNKTAYVCITTLRRIHCCLSYPVCSVQVPYYIVICGLSDCTTLLHIVINGTIFGKTLLDIKCVF